ncbi:hypothetical protein GpartN1_g4013.t1 [Galdieria partita]|uniref:Rab proteins geranylgeranyltransferase component n=1 Tax=Galdieria partita TaxID=83374 RepID=A0A9C7PZ80_9RHOD|nr:hypothetical protein GpartN1_g4013.t1 [Galdieria partita]
METDLKDAYFDIVVVGTGLPESVLAALLASSGKSILHIDSRPFYGGDWATLSLSKLKRFFSSSYLSENGTSEAKKAPTELEHTIRRKWQFQQYTDITLLPVKENSSFSDVQIVDHCSEDWLDRTQIDLTPQIILGSGEAVNMLVHSQAASYLEFRGVDEILWLDESGEPQKVPTSRNDIFRSTLLTPVEKRIFMKFLKTCAAYEQSLVQYEGHDGGLLSAGQVVSSYEEAEREQIQKWCECFHCVDDWLDQLHFTDRLKRYLFALLDCCGEKYESCAVATAVKRISQYCCAVQRFRISSGFLYSKYGTGDICEALCRRCAVHGGVYILNRQLAYLICDSSLQVIGLVTDHGDIIRCSVVVGSSNWEVDYTDSSCMRRLPTEKGRWKLYMVLDRPLVLPGRGVCVFTIQVVDTSLSNECYLVEGLQIEQQVDSLHTVYVLYLLCDDIEHGKIAVMHALKQLMHPVTMDSEVAHRSSDLSQLSKHFRGLKYACIGYCRDWEPGIQLGHYYSCYLEKDIHSIQTRVDQVYPFYENIMREWDS